METIEHQLQFAQLKASFFIGKMIDVTEGGNPLHNNDKDALHKLREINSFEDFYKELENHPRDESGLVITFWDEFQQFIQGELFS